MGWLYRCFHYSIAYLQVFFTACKAIICSRIQWDFNGKIGRSASKEKFSSLLKSKCIPCLLCGLDTCRINSTDGNFLDFTVRRALFKIFHTTSQLIIFDCQNYSNFPDIIVSLQQRKCKYLKTFAASENSLCQSLSSFAQRELDSLDNNYHNYLAALTDFNYSLAHDFYHIVLFAFHC